MIIVTSAIPGEGKSTVATNLALAFGAEAGGKALLVDADMRRPTIDTWLQPAPALGLSEVLAQRAKLDHALLSLEQSALMVLPAGSSPDDPLTLLESEMSKELFSELRRRFDWIVVDTPPIVPFSDADAVGGLSDGILMVVRKETTPASLYLEGIAAATSTQVLGVVFNDVTRGLTVSSSYYSEYYSSYAREPKK
jgi:capsular exopolysaccharide synthesis family protein